MKKNKFQNFVIAALLTFGTWLDANAVSVMGARSCGDWVKNAQDPNGWPVIVQNAWLGGFLSGKTLSSGVDVLKGQSAESLYLWVDKYCRNNPLDNSADAGEELFIELKKKSRL